MVWKYAERFSRGSRASPDSASLRTEPSVSYFMTVTRFLVTTLGMINTVGWYVATSVIQHMCFMIRHGMLMMHNSRNNCSVANVTRSHRMGVSWVCYAITETRAYCMSVTNTMTFQCNTA
ncbi:hypothetical protein E2C01_063123 [Portunus trituberculatus]|uniref:Uncharacterized protein n=1 Tax=Portunus trituberculatus TaxID=210409 RepID=A0A5B7HCV8_PORTR|nr:hypothetical protein [Portunus trituberculatus]